MVLKFGGTSVADVPQIKKISYKIKSEVDEGNKVIVVVSAMSGVTNNLIELVNNTSELAHIQNMMLCYLLENKSQLRY